jgi:hypothetical protein
MEEFKYLWDGSEPGWFLQRTDHIVWHLIIHFGETEPSKQEIVKLHQTVPELRSKTVTAIYQEMKGLSSYQTRETYGNIESRSLYAQLCEQGLNAELGSEQVGGYLPVSKDNCPLLIEDDGLAKIIVQKMIEAGVEIVEIYVD